jgi:hypothetical protein
MSVTLSNDQIDAALPRVAPGLSQYLWLQANRDASDLRSNADYRRRFNHFYRVRRGQEWQVHFYGLLERMKRQQVDFGTVLRALHTATGRWEASFASKLLATIDPHMPVIDSVVRKNLGLRFPAATHENRADALEKLHTTLAATLNEFLATHGGRYLVHRFRQTYPAVDITPIKMVDFVLWQTRPNATRMAAGRR